MNFDDDLNIKTKVSNELKEIHTKNTNRMFREKDKSDRQTVEQCIDPRISRIIVKLKNNGLLSEFNGCLSTGKEANVYYAKGSAIASEDIKELAVKIYKTSILIFKDRERYINGEFRFRHGYCKGNPRKMVAIWAEKEVRNLKRIAISGIPVPKPYILKSNMIVMEFIGKDGVAAPRLKDSLSQIETIEDFDRVYIEVLDIMRKMYRLCKLVHSDFSEYNLLYYERKVYVIDVAQAVENDHPNSMNFLKRDCHNINDFFEKNGIETLTDKQVFDYISKLDILDKERLKYIEDKRAENGISKVNDPLYKERDNGTFSNFEIPRTLMEEDVDKITGNADVETALRNICGIVKTNQSNKGVKAFSNKDEDNKKINEDHYGEKDDEDEEEEDNDEEDDDDDNDQSQDEDIKEEDDDDNPIKEKKPRIDPFEGLSKKERQQKVKEENKIKRQNKTMTKKKKHKIIKKTAHKH